MTFLEIRNTIVKKLEKHIGVPVVLSDQAQPVPPFPFCFYTVTTPYAPTGEFGNYTKTANGENIINTRAEQPHATFSFTVCSVNRYEGEDYIYGEDETQQIAEQAQGFFLHAAYDDLSNLGIVVAEVMNAANRTALVVDEAARRYGFDVRIRYKRIDTRTDSTVETYAIRKELPNA